MHTRYQDNKLIGLKLTVCHGAIVKRFTYLVPDANIALVPLVPCVEIRALDDMVTKELKQVLAFFVPQAFKVRDTLGIDIERFIPSGPQKYQPCLCSEPRANQA